MYSPVSAREFDQIPPIRRPEMDGVIEHFAKCFDSSKNLDFPLVRPREIIFLSPTIFWEEFHHSRFTFLWYSERENGVDIVTWVEVRKGVPQDWNPHISAFQ